MLWFKKKALKIEVPETKYKLVPVIKSVKIKTNVVQLYIENYSHEIIVKGSVHVERFYSQQTQPRVEFIHAPDLTQYQISGQSDFYTFNVNGQWHTYPKDTIKKIIILDGPDEIVEVEVDEVVPVGTEEVPV
tara:strand:- start:1915 stop:2310 length:396 start_codon:yes stop_codon:yes gene_type:complete